MTKNNGLLAQLQAIKVRLPEAECFVSEWDRSITLRGLTVKEGRALDKQFQGNGKEEGDEKTIRLIAHLIVDDNGERALANEEGAALIDSLSQSTVVKLINTFNKVSGLGEEKNSEATPSSESSIDSQDTSVGQLPN